jgi:hypothetical protein
MKMKGIINYYTACPETVNSIEGWVISPREKISISECYTLTDTSDAEVRKRAELGQLKSGDDVEFELVTDCYIKDDGVRSVHTTKAKIIFGKDNTQKLFLIDIDGTICDDIKNEDSHLYETAGVFEGALDIINKWHDEGHVITFFTARESKDRLVTEDWLQRYGFKYHGLVMDKPRISDGQEYVWIDNKKVRAVTYLGTWSDLVEVDARIQIFI